MLEEYSEGCSFKQGFRYYREDYMSIDLKQLMNIWEKVNHATEKKKDKKGGNMLGEFQASKRGWNIGWESGRKRNREVRGRRGIMPIMLGHCDSFMC